jgi:hypothetical protein
MNRKDVCILINSTPKYFSLLPLQLTMLRRYAPELHWPVYFATEAVDHTITRQLQSEFAVNIIPLSMNESGFLESRLAALKQLPSEILYVLPLQEDFLLDRQPMYHMLRDALFILDTDRYVSSLRLMPCPGPHDDDIQYNKNKPWKVLGGKNQYIFTYQATLWRRVDLAMYFTELIASIKRDFQKADVAARKHLALTSNLGENKYGQSLLLKTMPDTLHLAWPREGSWSNAVYLCPWPYRPTAVTRGSLEPFATELFQRESVNLQDFALNSKNLMN